MSLKIRDYTSADFQRLHAIDRICFEPGIAYSRTQLLFYVRTPDSITKVAELEDDIAGFVVGRISDDLCGHVLTLDVIPEARRQGVGTTLISVLHDEFYRHGIMMTFLEVDIGNEGALKFYQGFHYEPVEKLCGYYGDSRDAYRMVRFADVPRT